MYLLQKRIGLLVFGNAKKNIHYIERKCSCLLLLYLHLIFSNVSNLQSKTCNRHFMTKLARPAEYTDCISAEG